MRIGVLDGRAVIIDGDHGLDVAEASAGRFGPAITGILENWDEFSAWAADADATAGVAFDAEALQNPVPEPRQVFAVGLNYAAHAAESQYAIPDFPPTFTKFRTSLAGPRGTVELPGDSVDWEVELVAVIGRYAHKVPEAEGWDYVSTLTAGQDISERDTQFDAKPPQFSLGKSYPGFAPLGPVLVTPDEFPDRDDIEIGCTVNGEQMQKSRTSAMLFSVPKLVAYLSGITPLLPGDIIFTGTPDGVGLGRTPQRYLMDGDVLRSSIAGIGELEQIFVAPSGE
ncbi:fumarylacetoacetate hydrolase family protein [Tsukamurella tyrosinosolvens]|uniref:fumarylacetoacetate hydrolase family protein n=1 Tax=Tsukamurella tyrosinosolvens TaxID=57704 RepID=UPI000DF6B4C3|nr:fumarylacetoacetate hydrolase family protein [Tsukamurella tyrosinosolvens]RDB47343.1 fumarylacetoacetate hydrolase family protein [Tsukamurella tyrosinosolvens]